MNLEELRADWHRAVERDRPRDAIKALVQLEKVEPNEPRWSQRLGESYRRIGDEENAVEAFVRAFRGYFEKGFLPRAIAMAKLVKSMDAARGDLMERSLPKGAPPPPVLPPPRRRPPPLPVAAQVVKAAPLSRAPDAKEDEVRFSDAPDASMKIDLDDLEISEVITLDVDDVSIISVRPSVAPKEEEIEEVSAYDAYSAMSSLRLFAVASRDALMALADAADLKEFVPGAMVIVRDEPAFALYAIISGTAKVTVPGSPEIRLGEGDVFGEGCLLDEGRRQADVKAESQLMTLRIEKKALDEITKKHPEIEDVLFDLLARRLLTNLLYTSPLFASFDPAVRLELAQKFEVRRAEPGTVLAERGRKSDGLYVLLSGNVMAEAEAGPPKRIARGTAFGHASLMGTAMADATVRSASEAVLLRLPAASFNALATLYPPVLAHLAETAHEPLPASRDPRKG